VTNLELTEAIVFTMSMNGYDLTTHLQADAQQRVIAVRLGLLAFQ
jgi:hypothetical protein